MFPNNNKIYHCYWPYYNHYACTNYYGFNGSSGPGHNYGITEQKVPLYYVNAAAAPVYTMGSRSHSSTYQNFGQSCESPLDLTHPNPPLKKTRPDRIEVENFMREYRIHKAEREAAKANNNKITKARKGKRTVSNQKTNPVVNSTSKVNTTTRRQAPFEVTSTVGNFPTNIETVRPGAVDASNHFDSKSLRSANSSHINQAVLCDFFSNNNLLYHPVRFDRQQPFLVASVSNQRDDSCVDNAAQYTNKQTCPENIKNFTDCLIGKAISYPPRNRINSLVHRQKVNGKTKGEGICTKNDESHVKQANSIAVDMKLDLRASSNSSGGDSGHYTIGSNDQQMNLSFENDLLRSTIQYGSQMRLRKFTFLVDDFLSEDFALDGYDTPNPVVRMSREKYNWIFMDHPQMSRKFVRGENSHELELQPILKRRKVSDQRQKNRITIAIADIEEFITQKTTLEKEHLINRYRTFKNVLSTALDVDDPIF